MKNDKRIKGARTKPGKHLAQVQAQKYRCFLTGEELTPENVYGILEKPTGELKPENVRWCTQDAGRLVDGIGISKAIELMEKILRHRRPELFASPEQPKD